MTDSAGLAESVVWSRRAPGARVGHAMADARPRGRPLGLRPALRPRAVRGAGPGGRRRRADHQPLRLRPGAGAGRLRAAPRVLPAGAGRPPGAPAGGPRTPPPPAGPRAA